MRLIPLKGELRRAVGYVRVSQVGGREGESFLSPDVQREKIEAWASYRDYRLVGWYTDLDVSGRAGVRRPEFERMMADAAAGRFEAVAVYRLTRFARSVSQAASRYAELRQHNVALVSVTEDIDTTTASGGFMQNMLFAMAEFESQRIGEEWRNVHAARRRRGIAHVARPTLGYRIAGAEIVDVEPAEARAVRLAYQLRARGLGYGAIRSALEREGFASKMGNPRIPQSTLTRVLRNPIYAGLVRQPDGQLADATHEALIPRELWDQVQAVAPRANGMARHKAALLSGLMVCSGCGYRMNYERGRGTAQHARAVYRCAAKARSNPCPLGVSIVAEYADDYVERAFLHRFDPKRMPNRGRLSRTRQQQTWARQAGRLRARVEELNRALDALAGQAFVKGTLAASEYERQAAGYLAERAQAEERADELERMVATVRPIERDVLGLWPSLPLERRQSALRLMIAHVTVKPTPRKGRGQRELVGQRLEIGWLR